MQTVKNFVLQFYQDRKNLILLNRIWKDINRTFSRNITHFFVTITLLITYFFTTVGLFN